MRLKTIKKSKQTHLFLAIHMVSSATINPLLTPLRGVGVLFISNKFEGERVLTREGGLI